MWRVLVTIFQLPSAGDLLTSLPPMPPLRLSLVNYHFCNAISLLCAVLFINIAVDSRVDKSEETSVDIFWLTNWLIVDLTNLLAWNGYTCYKIC